MDDIHEDIILAILTKCDVVTILIFEQVRCTVITDQIKTQLIDEH